MNINWFTVIAQIINFFILVWLLKRFLYKPVLNAIDQRDEKIASQLHDAKEEKAKAEKEHELFLQKNETFDKERAAKIHQVHEEANSEKQRLLEKVRQESNALRLKYEDSFVQQKEHLADTIKRQTKDAVFAIADKALADLANTNLEEQVVKVFVGKIQSLDNEDKIKLKVALDHTKGIMTIKSAFELSASSKSELEKTIGKITGQQNSFEYLLEPELVSGIEIYTQSYQLAWNIDSYLNSLINNNIITEKENASSRPE